MFSSFIAPTHVWIEHAVRSGKKNVCLPMLEVLARGFRVSRSEIRLEILIRTPGRTDCSTIKNLPGHQGRDSKAIARAVPVTAEPKPAAKDPEFCAIAPS